MNIYHNIGDINYKNIMFHKPVTNKIPNYKFFYKIMYDTHIFTLNSVIINVNIDTYTIIEENKKFKAIVQINNNFLESIKELEKNILKNVNSNKQIIYSCYKYLLFNKSTYMFDKIPETINLSLRLSGLWESDTTIGLTTKIYVNDYPSTVKLSNITC
uniref:Uncharacterized protein n=1 Tax=viral metagenome TaxID=1070528 RepID=A0A6C0EUK3_9ZZZZ